MIDTTLVFHQLFDHESSTYTYLLADSKSGEAIIIDPVFEQTQRDLKLIDELGLKLQYIFETHIHADHVTAAGQLRKATGAKLAVSQAAKLTCSDIAIEHGQQFQFGVHTIKALATPGHTNTCMSFYMNGMVFTGDALLIRGCGRTDFQQGDACVLFQSVREQLFTLPDETLIFPAHDYKGLTHSTVATEKQHNPRLGLGQSQDEFLAIMDQLNLAEPKKIKQAVPANLACGE